MTQNRMLFWLLTLLLLPTAAHARKVNLDWKPIKNAVKYNLKIQDPSGKVLVDATLEENVWAGDLKPNQYKFQVRAYDFIGRAGQWSKLAALNVKPIELVKPPLISPIGSVASPEGNQIRLNWAKIEGAETYEIKVGRVGDSNPKTVTVKEPPYTFNVSGTGSYFWQVRAIGDTVGPIASTEFRLEAKANFVKRSSTLSLVYLPSVYVNRTKSKDPAGFNETFRGVAQTIKLRGEYWGADDTLQGYSLEMENTLFRRDNTWYNQKSFELALKNRRPFSGEAYQFRFFPILGVQGREYIQFSPIQDGIKITRLWAFGPTVTLEIRKQLSETWGSTTDVSYFLPFFLTSSNEARQFSGGASYRNLRMTQTFARLFSDHWSWSVGAAATLRSLGTTAGGDNDQSSSIYMDSLSLTGGLIFHF